MAQPRPQARRCATGAARRSSSNRLGRQHCWTPSGWYPARAACRAVACSRRASWLPSHWRLADSTRRHAGLPCAVRQGATTVSRSPPAWKDKELRSFANVVTSSPLVLGNRAALKRSFESGGASLLLACTITCIDVRFSGGCPLRSSRAPCVSARTSRSLPARSSTGTLCAR
jgi:hypothetical protein